jgi:cation:H+ antiporter
MEVPLAIAAQEILTLLVSVVILARSSSWVVDNIVKISQFFRVSQVAIGFLLLAVATSLPELSVSVVSSALGEGAIAAGNVFGSNIANILLILGIGAFLYGLKVSRGDLRDIGQVLLLTTVISAYIIFNSMVGQKALGFAEGILLLGLFAGYVWHTLKRKRAETGDGTDKTTKKEALDAFLQFGVGVILVLVSSGFVVSSATSLARSFGIAESFIGATIIAIGTSLPELSIDIQAIRKKRYGVALGDAIGSNMANITLVLGAAAAINPIQITLPVFIAALLFAVIANILLLYLAAVHKELKKAEGMLFLVVYAVYLIVAFMLQINEISS